MWLVIHKFEDHEEYKYFFWHFRAFNYCLENDVPNIMGKLPIYDEGISGEIGWLFGDRRLDYSTFDRNLVEELLRLKDRTCGFCGGKPVVGYETHEMCGTTVCRNCARPETLALEPDGRIKIPDVGGAFDIGGNCHKFWWMK